MYIVCPAAGYINWLYCQNNPSELLPLAVKTVNIHFFPKFLSFIVTGPGILRLLQIYEVLQIIKTDNKRNYRIA
jgi:hypothetical protein